MDPKKHIALITTWFPPRNGVAVGRMAAFVKYLQPKYKVTVITTREGNEPEEESVFDARIIRVRNRGLLPLLRERAGEPALVHKAKVLWNVGVRSLKPHENLSWMKGVERQLQLLHEKNPVDVILSSYAPTAAHLAALHFARLHPQIRWVADMRDEMAGNPHVQGGDMLEKAEQEINSRADAVTSVSAELVEAFKARMPDVKNFEEVRNGFDHAITPSAHFNPVFTIAYAGTFYGSNKPGLFFKGLQRFCEKHKEKVALWFIGTHKNFDIPEIFRSDTRFFPVMPNEEAVRQLAQADATLLTLAPVKRKGVYTGKLFDYLSVKRPVIAIIDSTGPAAAMIREMNGGFVAGYDASEVETAIESAWALWKERRPLPVPDAAIERLNRRYQVEKLERLIDRLLQA